MQKSPAYLLPLIDYIGEIYVEAIKIDVDNYEDVDDKGENNITKLPLGVYTKNHKICSDRSVFPNLLELSSVYLDGTLDVSEYGGALWELARGCPFKCSYCYESKGEKCVQYFSDERI